MCSDCRKGAARFRRSAGGGGVGVCKRCLPDCCGLGARAMLHSGMLPLVQVMAAGAMSEVEDSGKEAARLLFSSGLQPLGGICGCTSVSITSLLISMFSITIILVEKNSMIFLFHRCGF
mmetsp:Transcript_49570/g.103422  ORF Transcript_49570/g.103422 Transcript_49570/m.103422 type:complete len:119 (+) Transcript_49570:279-635(+)